MKFMVSPGTEIVLNGDAMRRGVPTRTALLTQKEYTQSTRAPFHSDVFTYLFEKPRSLPIDPTWSSWTLVAQNFFSPFFFDPRAKASEMIPLVTEAVNRDLKKERERMRRYREQPSPAGPTPEVVHAR
jgi:hypothetical protein